MPATGRVLRADHVAAHVATLAYSPNGSLLAVGTDHGDPARRTPRSGAVVKRSRASARSPQAWCSERPGVAALAFSPDGRELAATSISGVALAERARPERARARVKYPAVGDSMVFTRDGRELIVGGRVRQRLQRLRRCPAAGCARVVVTGARGRQAAGPRWSRSAPTAASSRSASPDVGHANGAVSIYSTRTWAKRVRRATRSPTSRSPRSPSAPTARALAIGAEDGTAGVWSLATHEQLVAYDGPTAAVTAMAFTPGGSPCSPRRTTGPCACGGRSASSRRSCRVAGNIDGDRPSRQTLLAVVAADAGRKLWLYSVPPAGRPPLGLKTVGTAHASGGALSDDGATRRHLHAAAIPPRACRCAARCGSGASPSAGSCKTLPPAAVFESRDQPRRLAPLPARAGLRTAQRDRPGLRS